MESRISNFWLFIFIVLGLFLVWYFKTIIVFVLISAVISLILMPLVNLLSKVGVWKYTLPRWLAALLSLILLILAGTSFLYFFIPLLLYEVQLLYDISPQQIINYFEGPLVRLENFLEQFDIVADPRVMIRDYFKETIIGIFDISIVTAFFNRFFGLTLELFVGIFSIFFISFFFLKEEEMFPNMILALTPDEYVDSVLKVLGKLKYLLTRFFIGLLIQIFFIAFTASLGLSIIGVENPVLIGVFAGIINVIPYLGPVLGGTFAIFSGIVSNLDLAFYPDVTFLILQILIVFVIVQQLDNLIFQPIIYSTSVKAHPVEIFIVILIAARIAGIPGMIVAIPVYTVIRVIAKEFLTEFKFVQKLTKNL